jgi:hypothetical protein
MFEKTKEKAATLINDRVTAPIRTAVVIATVALLVSLLALTVAARRAV